MLKFYTYSPLTAELTGSQVLVFPEYATDITPPIMGANEVAIFKNGAWTVAPDYRGVEVWHGGEGDARIPMTITEIGVTPQSLNASLTPPEPTEDELKKLMSGRLVSAKAALKARLKTEFNGLLTAVAGTDSPFKLSIYNYKVTLAVRILDGSASDIELEPVKSELHSMKRSNRMPDNATVKDLANLWLAKSATMNMLTQQVSNAVSAVEASIETADTIAALETIKTDAEAAKERFLGSLKAAQSAKPQAEPQASPKKDEPKKEDVKVQTVEPEPEAEPQTLAPDNNSTAVGGN